ncbi:hypothetical protein [Streptomyces sp. NPDC046862]|uniref:hypothetical protein n=1 Tax=Streptomyces sp. NPDC046862 TaxID=3154603 RepID=UPI003454A8D9
MMRARIAPVLRTFISIASGWGWRRFSPLGRTLRAAEKKRAAARAESRRHRDRQLSEALGSSLGQWGPEQLERKRAEVNLMADLMTSLAPATTAQESSGVQAAGQQRNSASGRKEASAGSLPSGDTRSNVGVLDQDSSNDTEEELPRAETHAVKHGHWMSMVAVLAVLVSIFPLLSQERFAPPRDTSAAPGSSEFRGVGGGDRNETPRSLLQETPLPDRDESERDSVTDGDSAIQRPDAFGAYETARRIQIAEYQGAGRTWCVLADPASRNCTTTMERSFEASKPARRAVLRVSSSIGKVNDDETSVEILLSLGNAHRRSFPMQWVDGRWQADPTTVLAARQRGGVYTMVVLDACARDC